MRALDRLPARARAACRPLRSGPPACAVAGDGVLATGFSSIAGPTLRRASCPIARPSAASSSTPSSGKPAIHSRRPTGSSPDGDACRYTIAHVLVGWRRRRLDPAPGPHRLLRPRSPFSAAPTPTTRRRIPSKPSPAHQDPTVGRSICDDYHEAATYTVVPTRHQANAGQGPRTAFKVHLPDRRHDAACFPYAQVRSGTAPGRSVSSIFERPPAGPRSSSTGRAETERPQGPHRPRPGMRCQGCLPLGHGPFEVHHGRSRRRRRPRPDADALPAPRRLEPTATPDRRPRTEPTPEPPSRPARSSRRRARPEPSPTPLAGRSRRRRAARPTARTAYVPAHRELHRRPGRGSVDPAVVATNVLLTLLDPVPLRPDGRDLQQHDGRQPRRGPRLVGAAAPRTAGVHGRAQRLAARRSPRCPAPGASAASLRVLLILSLLGMIYGFLSPDFG